MKKQKTVKTVWEVWGFDVWGNKDDGYTVNNRFCIDRERVLTLRIKTVNQGTKREFDYVEISDNMLKEIFGVSCKISVDGDDVNYYVSRESDDYPLGELSCQSHSSLSPIHYSYTYHIDVDERGVFSAHVDDSQDKSVFSFHYGYGGDDDTFTIFDMGYMKHGEDVNGLHAYLKELGILPGNSSLKMG